VDVPGVRGRVGVRRLRVDAVVEELEHDPAREVEDGGVDRDARVADVTPEVRPVEHGPPARLELEEPLPELERGLDARHRDPDVVHAPDGRRRELGGPHAADRRALTAESRILTGTV
jgi:hypothetical protein